jgi:antitoxin ParD1/3/4
MANNISPFFLINYQDLVTLIQIIIAMSKNTSISLGSHFEDFINSSVSSGKYSSASEVVRSALRLLESEEKKLKDLREALIEGEKSTMNENFNPEQHLTDLHRKYL